MDKFSKEFYASRLEDWITKYIKVKELLKLIKSIEKDIKKNGGQIIRISDRKSTLYIEEFRTSRLSTPLDRHSVGLGVLENTEGLFNKNEKIFNTPLMYEINELFKEIEDLDYCDDIKIFLYFLSIEVHNVYVFYLSIEKNIYNRVNDHLHSRKKYEKMTKEELLEELVDLTDITYLMYSFFSYIDLNLEAIHEILKYFDDHFQILNNDISMHKLFFRKYLIKKDSDLKYILSFKIIIESSALIESYYQEILKIDNSKEIKAQVKELKEVLLYLNEKNTDRVNDDIHEVYQKEITPHSNNIIKQKKNIKIDIQNSFFIDVHQQENYYKRLGEKQYDKEINITITNKNMNNLILLYLHTFIYSLFYIIPYLSFYFYYVKNKINFYYLGFIITSTHLGNLISKIIMNFSEKYKLRLIISCIFFMCSFGLTVYSESFINENLNLMLYFILNFISRFIYGYSCGRVITRKYIMLYLPESEIKYYSLIYIIISYFGLLCGVIINILINIKEPSFNSVVKVLPFQVENHIFLFCIGFIIAFFYLFIILCFFTEPTKGSMLSQKRITISTKDDTCRDTIGPEKDIYEYKDYDDDYNKQDNREKISKGLFRSYNKDDNNNYKTNSDSSSSNNLNEIEYKTYTENINRLRINRIDSIVTNIGNEDMNNNIITNRNDSTNNQLNISFTKRETNKKEKEKKTINIFQNELMSAEEIKGLNSIEKNLISLNSKNNFDDTNLLPHELDRIKKNQFKNNRNYICPLFLFIISLLLTNSLNEFIFLSMPLNFLKYNDNEQLIILENDVIIAITVLQIFSFPFITFIRMMKTLNIERRLLLIFYLLLYFMMIGFSVCKYLFYNDLREDIYSFKSLSYRFILLIIFILSNLIEGTTNLLSYKIIPPFVKICHINNKYIISYSTVIGKILGGALYIVLFITENRKENQIFENTNIFKQSTYIFCGFTIVSFFILCLCYRYLRVRAISKLFYISD